MSPRPLLKSGGLELAFLRALGIGGYETYEMIGASENDNRNDHADARQTAGENLMQCSGVTCVRVLGLRGAVTT